MRDIKNHNSDSLVFPKPCAVRVGTSCLSHCSCCEQEEQVVTQHRGRDLYNLPCAEAESSQQQNYIAMTNTGSSGLQRFSSHLQLCAVLVGGDGL